MFKGELIIDKKTYKIMRYLYGKSDVPFSLLKKKFGEDSALVVIGLCRHDYAAMRLPDGSLTTDLSSFLPDYGKFSLLIPGNKRVEEIRENKVIAYTPLLLSAVSVIVSIVALLVSVDGVLINIVIQ